MMKYDFSVLNDKEFEEFCCDLLSKKSGNDFQSFKKGKDKGVDLRFATSSNKNAIIVQVKQYYTDYKTLYRNLQKQELPKVKKLNPGQYWLATSLSLSKLEKDSIHQLFESYIPTANYIFDVVDLNRLLSRYPTIERRWYKLWMTSTNVLQTILNSAIIGRSNFHGERIKKHIKLYVKTRFYDQAIKILKDKKVLLITGQPGAGKTSLANQLTYELLRQNFQFVYIDRDIKEAENVFETNMAEKLLFYFDDFLGANYYEILHPKSSESAISNFIERIQSSSDKYLILTTRTTILNNAISKFEKLKRAKTEVAQLEIEIGEYSHEEKGQILYSHIFHSSIPDVYKYELFRNKNYWMIIKHPNYSPRLMDHFTSEHFIKNISSENYLDFVLKTLINPKEVWAHSFHNNLESEDRFLIGSLFSFGTNFFYWEFSFNDSVPLKCLQKAYEARLKMETSHHGHVTSTDSFNSSIKRLLDGYFASEKEDSERRDVSFRFINPSIADYLLNYFRNSIEEKWRLIKGCIYIHQLQFCYDRLLREDEEHVEFVKYIIENKENFLPTLHFQKHHPMKVENAYRIELLKLISDEVYLDDTLLFTAPVISDFLETIEYHNVNYDGFDEIITVLSSISQKKRFKNIILKHWNEIMINLWEAKKDEEHYEKVHELFELYDQDFADFQKISGHKARMLKTYGEYMNEVTQSLIYDKTNNVVKPGDLEELKESVRSERRELYEKFNFSDDDFDEYFYFNDLDEDELISKNRNKEDTILNLEGSNAISKGSSENAMTVKVDRLFENFVWKNGKKHK